MFCEKKVMIFKKKDRGAWQRIKNNADRVLSALQTHGISVVAEENGIL